MTGTTKLFDRIEQKLNLMIQLLGSNVTSPEDAKPTAVVAVVCEVQSETLFFPLQHNEKDEKKG